MKVFLRRLVTLVLLLFLSVTLFFQNSALARPGADDGEMRVAKNERVEDGGGGGGSSGAFWSQLQRRFIRDVDKATKEISDSEKDRQRRDIVKEVTGESHSPRGGPQE